MRDSEFQDRPELPLHIRGEEEKPRLMFWQRMSRGMEVFIYLLLLLAVLKIFGPEWDRQKELQAEATRLTQIREDRREEVVRLRQEHRLLKTDKEYLESIARDRLNLQRDGEYVIRIRREEEE